MKNTLKILAAVVALSVGSVSYIASAEARMMMHGHHGRCMMHSHHGRCMTMHHHKMMKHHMMHMMKKY